MDTFPITEFDAITDNYITAQNNANIVLPSNCVITFFGDAVKILVDKNCLECITYLTFESFKLPVYIYNGSIVVIHGLGSGPYAAGIIEKLVACGCDNFIICGGCGVLIKGSVLGMLFVPKSALRDEGTSYHYVKPSREIYMQEDVFTSLTQFLDRNKIPFKVVKTWTTDAIFRETRKKIQDRIKEGCSVVDMECASFYAVASYKKVKLGVILYAGDDLSGTTWDNRNWKDASTVRYELLKLSLKYMLERVENYDATISRGDWVELTD